MLPGDRVAVGSVKGVIKVYHVATGKLLKRFKLDQSQDPVWSMASLGSDRILASYADEEFSLRLWQQATGQQDPLWSQPKRHHNGRLTGRQDFGDRLN